MRDFLRFFFSPSPPELLAPLAVFFAVLAVPSEVVFAGALEAVDAGALPAVEAGLGAIGGDEVCWKSGGGVCSGRRSRCRGRRDEGWMRAAGRRREVFIRTRCLCLAATRQRAEPYFVERHQHHHVAGPCRVFPAPALV